MRRVHSFSLALLCLTLLSACKGGSPRLEGHWKGAKAEGVPVEQEAAATQYAQSLELWFKGDSLTVQSAGAKRAGNFKVVKDEPDQVTIKSTFANVEQQEVFVIVDANTVRWTVAQGRMVSLKKTAATK
jgi:hypothetical protein